MSIVFGKPVIACGYINVSQLPNRKGQHCLFFDEVRQEKGHRTTDHELQAFEAMTSFSGLWEVEEYVTIEWETCISSCTRCSCISLKHVMLHSVFVGGIPYNCSSPSLTRQG